ncbi:MAG: CBS domain-containing protein [Candidatus Tectomicrobia bacterium]|uniref:CBS domain-containing protein n=1 Tax=Tectimicrobiota bacterium TaxID=2528274 RepID=A0A932FXJ3_UNCTE|nr:CBS domain-containing protein [Candidatus Tectomicrobia bacterium]
MKVKDCYQQVTPDVDLVREETPIQEVIRIVSRNPASRAVFVIDEKGELTGIIGVQQLLNLLGMKYSRQDPLTLISEAMARVASDIMVSPQWVSLEDEVEEALKLAVQHGLQDIPVVEKGKVVGNLDCFEILNNVGK